jgi:hypothetical protein
MNGKLIFSSAFLLLLGATSFAQLSKEYPDWIQKANSFYEAKQYQQSADAFTKAFASNGGKGLPDDRYNAACAWALAGNKDSAFFMLNRIATRSNYSDLSHLQIDEDLTSLHTDKRWDDLCAIVKQNKDRAEAGLDKNLVSQLDQIFKDDQGGRMKYEDLQKKYGNNSKEVRDLWVDINYKDSINLIKVEQILDKYGWAGPDVVGQQGAITLFLVIQHSDIKVQEKYLPMMREAVKNNKASASDLALLEDRVALREGRKQIYGSQIGMYQDGGYYISPIEDPDNVDSRRAAVGLPPLAEYVQHWNLKWDPTEYKKELPKIEAEQAKMK